MLAVDWGIQATQTHVENFNEKFSYSSTKWIIKFNLFLSNDFPFRTWTAPGAEIVFHSKSLRALIISSHLPLFLLQCLAWTTFSSINIMISGEKRKRFSLNCCCSSFWTKLFLKLFFCFCLCSKKKFAASWNLNFHFHVEKPHSIFHWEKRKKKTKKL